MPRGENKGEIQDIRSTGRRRARRSLFRARREFSCVDCGRTSIEPPKDAPPWFQEIWPDVERVLDYSLQADHLTKDLNENREEYLVWRCARCHKEADSQTGKGESTISAPPYFG